MTSRSRLAASSELCKLQNLGKVPKRPILSNLSQFSDDVTGNVVLSGNNRYIPISLDCDDEIDSIFGSICGISSVTKQKNE